MEREDPAGLTPESRDDRAPASMEPGMLRRFGLVVGAAFGALGGFLWWRGHDTPAVVAWTAGGVLVVAAVVAPTRLGGFHRLWMGMARAISKVTTPIVMGVVYFLVLTPVAALVRLFGSNPIVHEPEDGSYWARREPDRQSSMTRKF